MSKESIRCVRCRYWTILLVLAATCAGLAQQQQPSGHLQEILNPDGSLRLGREIQGSFRTDGYRLELGPHGEPRLRPAALSAQYSIAAMADTADIHWDNRFVSSSGFNGPVLAILVDSGTVYFGGSFSCVGRLPAKNIVKWDGLEWSPLGDGLDGAVSAITKFKGDLYVGGTLFHAGGASVTNLARWDGNTWSTLGVYPNDGVNGQVRALLPLRDSLYIAGNFSWNGDTSKVDGMAIWNGTSLHPMAGHNVYTFQLHSLASDGINLYVGGGYFDFGPDTSRQFVFGVARWDGNSWGALGKVPGHGGVLGTVYCMAWENGSLYVGGNFDSAGVAGVKNVARWNGSDWTPMGAGLNATVHALLFSGGKVYAGGEFTASGIDTMNGVAAYDTSGSTWNLLGSGIAPHASSVWALAMHNASLYMGGYFSIWFNSYSSGEDIDYYLASWNGATFAPLGLELQADGIHGYGGNTSSFDWTQQQVNTIVCNGNLAYVGGNFTSVGSLRANNIACWNNSTKTWSTLGDGLNGVVISIALSGTDVYAGGLFFMAGGQPANSIARWDGVSWHPLGNPPNDGVQGGIYSLLFYSGHLYVVGSFQSAGGKSASNIAMWDGNAWTGLGGGLESYVFTVDVFHSELYAGGNFTHAGGTSANYLAKWDGVSWSAVGTYPDTGMSGPVWALHADGNCLYVGGQFTKAGSITANNIARWNGSAWSALGPGLNGTVRTISTSNGIVYTGGDFTASGVLTINHIARCDSASPAWSPLGSGTDLGVFALAKTGDDLFAGGRFTVAGDKGSSLIGRWNTSYVATDVGPETPFPSSFVLDQNYPNPFNPTTAISYQLSAVSEVRLAVYDILGREIEVLVNERKGPGKYEVRFDASRLASGVYFCRLTAGRYVEARKMLLMK